MRTVTILWTWRNAELKSHFRIPRIIDRAGGGDFDSVFWLGWAGLRRPVHGVGGRRAGPVARVLVGAAAEWLEGGSLAHWFDAVVHVRDTTPVHLLPNTDD
jgi:hypothetical protein